MRDRAAELIREPHAIEDGPWTDLQGKPLDNRRLAKELDRYSVRPKDMEVNANLPPPAIPRDGRNLRDQPGQRVRRRRTGRTP